jgi:NADH-quinone oxidoreductase subunit J
MSLDALPIEMLVFLVTAIAAVVSALLVVLHRNPVVNAMALIVNLACIAVFFLLLRAPFVAAVQVIVYAGAIMVLFLFVIMLLDLKAELHPPRGGAFQRVMAVFAGAAFLSLMVQAMRRSRPTFAMRDTLGVGHGTIERVGEEMFRNHLLSFELASVLLLVAMIGALVIARAFAENPDPQEPRA